MKNGCVADLLMECLLCVVMLQWWRHCISLRWNDWCSCNITYTCHFVQRFSRYAVL